MNELFGRTWKVQVGSLKVTELDIAFSAFATTGKDPNTSEIRIFNLAPASRALVEEATEAAVKLHAGYVTPVPLIFGGTARRIYTTRDGLDLVTIIQASDKGIELAATRLNKSYTPGTPVISVVRDLLNALNVGEGNLLEFENAYRARNGTNQFPDGFAVSGQSRRALGGLVRAAGLRWSIHNGVLQLQVPGRPLRAQAALVNPSTGLVGTPTRAAPGKKNKRPSVSATVLLRPELAPGRQVRLESDTITGSFEIVKIRYTGESRGPDWYARLEMRSVT